MAITVSNEASLLALGGLNEATRQFTQATRRLASGLRVENPSDDPGSFVFSERLRTRSLSLDRLSIDTQASRSLVQTASAGITTILADLQKIRVLAVNSSNGTLTSADRNANQTTLKSLRNEITSISNSTIFNSKVLLDGSFATGRSTLTFQVGPDGGNTITLNLRTLSSTALGIGSISVSTQTSASGALTNIDSAINIITNESAKSGSTDNRLLIGKDFIDLMNLAHKSAISAVTDADLASEIVAQARATILRQTSTSALAQANLFPQNVLSALLPSRNG